MGSCKGVFGVPRVFKYQVECHVSIVRENVKKQEGSGMGRRSSIVKVAGSTSRKSITIGHVKVQVGELVGQLVCESVGIKEGSPAYWRSAPVP